MSVFLGAYEKVSHENGLPETYWAHRNQTHLQHSFGGGRVAPINHYPWMASMHVYGSHECSATIISAKRLLTAAQCTIDKVAGEIQYRVGSRDSRSGGQFMYVEAIHNHPEYNPSTLRNDIAVVWLKKQIIFTMSEVAFLSLPETNERVEVDTITAVSGWERRGAYTSLMKYSHMSIISYEVCNRYYRGDVLDSMLCAEVPKPDGHQVRGNDEDYCQSDVGGPVTHMEKKIVIGVVIWGHGCNKRERPGVYTRVASHRDWIDSVM